MHASFAKTANVTEFLAGVTAVEGRGAREAGMLLVMGEAGFGKTATVRWWATQEDAIYLRSKASWSAHWVLSDLVRELGLAPARRSEDLFSQALAALAKHPQALVIDESEHMLRDCKVFETVRDLSDLTEVPVILVGMEAMQRRIARYPQIYSRIAKVVHFQAATIEDVRLCADTLAEVTLADDLVAEIHQQTAGRVREVINALATVERQARRGGLDTVALADMDGQVLTHDWQARRPRLVRSGGKGVK